MPKHNKRPRDEIGWLIPREGSRSRQVYDLLKCGKSRTEIKAALPATSQGTIDGMLWQIKNSEKLNAAKRSRKTGLPKPSEPTLSCEELDRRISACTRAMSELGPLPDLEEKRQELVSMRLTIELEAFFKRVAPERFSEEEKNKIRSRFRTGLHRYGPTDLVWGATCNEINALLHEKGAVLKAELSKALWAQAAAENRVKWFDASHASA